MLAGEVVSLASAEGRQQVLLTKQLGESVKWLKWALNSELGSTSHGEALIMYIYIPICCSSEKHFIRVSVSWILCG